jgi:hypothetical protein
MRRQDLGEGKFITPEPNGAHIAAKRVWQAFYAMGQTLVLHQQGR